MKRIVVFLGMALFTGMLFAQSAADEILKWKQLYDSGVISEAEFQAKKTQILEGGHTAANSPTANQDAAGTVSFGAMKFEAGSPDLYAHIHRLIDDDLEDNKAQVAALSKGLTPMQREQMYDAHEKSMGLPFALNFLLGWGIGSFIQGDGGGGAFQCAFEGSGVLCIIIGAATLSTDTKKNTGSYALIASGGVFVASAAIYGLIRPWVYGSSYNRLLRNSLQGTPIAVQFAPIINPFDNSYGVAFKMNL